jgi:ABC-2 type transport system permease protein
MTLTRALYAETLKLKRTIALKMVVLAPVAVVLLTLFMASQAPFSTLHRSNSSVDAWRALSRVNLQFWGLLMLPMYVTLQTALIAGLDHSDNQWKALFARPVPRWTIYAAKLIVVTAMVAVSAAVLVTGVMAEGKTLHWWNAGLEFGASVPVATIAGQAAQMTALAFLFLSIQHWVSLRWKSFSVAVGFGIVALVTSFAMLLAAGPYGAWPQYFPWSLPMLVIARQPGNIGMALWICVITGIVASAAGCIDFCKREIS